MGSERSRKTGVLYGWEWVERSTTREGDKRPTRKNANRNEKIVRLKTIGKGKGGGAEKRNHYNPKS